MNDNAYTKDGQTPTKLKLLPSLANTLGFSPSIPRPYLPYDDTPRRIHVPEGRALVMCASNYNHYPMACIETLGKNPDLLFEFTYYTYDTIMQTSISGNDVFGAFNLAALQAFIEIFDINTVMAQYEQMKALKLEADPTSQIDDKIIINRIERIIAVIYNKCAYLLKQPTVRYFRSKQSQPVEMLDHAAIDEIFSVLSRLNTRLTGFTMLRPVYDYLTSETLQSQSYLQGIKHSIQNHTLSHDALIHLVNLTIENAELTNMLLVRYANFLKENEPSVPWNQLPWSFPMAYVLFYEIHKLQIRGKIPKKAALVTNGLSTVYLWHAKKDLDHRFKNQENKAINAKLLHPNKRAFEEQADLLPKKPRLMLTP